MSQFCWTICVVLEFVCFLIFQIYLYESGHNIYLSIRSNLLLRSFVFTNFWLFTLLVIKVLNAKISTKIVDLFIPPCSSPSFCFIAFEIILLCILYTTIPFGEQNLILGSEPLPPLLVFSS